MLHFFNGVIVWIGSFVVVFIILLVVIALNKGEVDSFLVVVAVVVAVVVDLVVKAT